MKRTAVAVLAVLLGGIVMMDVAAAHGPSCGQRWGVHTGRW